MDRRAFVAGVAGASSRLSGNQVADTLAKRADIDLSSRV